jgi:tubulin-specific chaperone D
MHFKSTVIQKLQLAIDVYRGLAEVEATRKDVLAKLCNMLLHPFPKVCIIKKCKEYLLMIFQIRVATAETLFVVTHITSLKNYDWSHEAKSLKPAAAEVKKQVDSL